MEARSIYIVLDWRRVDASHRCAPFEHDNVKVPSRAQRGKPRVPPLQRIMVQIPNQARFPVGFGTRKSIKTIATDETYQNRLTSDQNRYNRSMDEIRLDSEFVGG